MNRPFFVRLLLSLILLLSQQMATVHALEHVSGALDAPGAIAEIGAQGSDETSELAKAVAQHQSCHQCLAFAQLAAPMASTVRAFAPSQSVIHGAEPADTRFQPGDRVRAFQARAPPVV